MTNIWIVWKCDDYDNYYLVSAHRSRDSAITAALEACPLTPSRIAEEPHWCAHWESGCFVMVDALQLHPNKNKPSSSCLGQ